MSALARGALCLGGISLSQVKDSTKHPSIASIKCNKYKKMLNLFLFTETFNSDFFSACPLFTYNNVGEARIEKSGGEHQHESGETPFRGLDISWRLCRLEMLGERTPTGAPPGLFGTFHRRQGLRRKEM